MTAIPVFRSRCSVLLVLAFVLIACGGCVGSAAPARVSILGSWAGAEEEQFRQVLKTFEQQHGIQVDYIGSAAVDQVLQAGVQKGTPPDIAILPNLGDVARYRDELTPLDESIVGEYSPQWRELAKAGMGRLYAVPVQANLKGLVWFNREHPPPREPRTFEELIALGRDIAAGGATPWCMGVAAQATSGWPGTDWIENILLRRSGMDAYQQWAAGQLAWTSPQVREAWTTWGQVVTEPGQVRGGSTAALHTEFGDAARPMFADEAGCLMEHQGSLISSFYSGYDETLQRGTDFDYFPFPPFSGAHADTTGDPREVSADMASVFNETPEARELIRFLASAEAQKQWPATNAFSASTAVPVDVYDPVGERIAADLTGAAPLCFDASDLMPATVRGAFYRAVLEYLADPGQLDLLLGELDEVRAAIPAEQWLTVACGR